MAKQTKHRILMALVVIALGIIILPFFQNAKDLSNDRLSVQAPPFPEPVLDASNTDTDVSHASAQTAADEAAPQDLFSITRPSIISYRLFHADGGHDNRTATEPMQSEMQRTTSVNPQRIEKKAVVVMHSAMDESMLGHLKNLAWVIQMGSFKNKSNALHLANYLRANGYSAFIQHVATAFGESTRVFVGPESRLKTVHSLAGQLENDMHLRGIIISYQPLNL